MTFIWMTVMPSYSPLPNNLRVICVLFPLCSTSQTEDGERQQPPAKRKRVYPDTDKASLTQKVSVFLSYVVVGVLIFYHSLFSSPQHHLQSLQPRVPSAPPFVDPVTIIICTPIDFSINSQAPIFRIPIPEYPCYDDADEFITNFCLAIENSENGAFQPCNLVICASHYCCKVWHLQDPAGFECMYSLTTSPKDAGTHSWSP